VEAHEQAGDVLGSYTLERCLGEGAMGRVWLGRHVKLGRHAAIKVLKTEHSANSELVGRFFDEARAVNQINHEHIVAISDFVEELEPARVYCIMEYLPGESLERRFAREPLQLAETVSVMKQVCEALAAAHRLNIVHRDVKPDNIFLCIKADGSLYAKVLDFGVAKLSPAMKRDAVTTTQSGQMVGTPAYMAPEQVVGIEVDAKADVYAAGTVLYQLLAGHLPFEDTDVGKLSLKVIKEPPPPLPSRNPLKERIPSRLAKLVKAALAKEPQDRPSIDEVIAALAAPPEQRRGGVVLAVAAAVAAGAAGFVMLRPPPPPHIVETVATVKLTVRSEPQGAVVTRSDNHARLGVTPWTTEVLQGSPALEVTVSLDGYVPVTRTLETQGNTDVAVMLARTPLDLPPPPPPPTTAAEPVRPAKKQKKMQLSDEGTLDPFAP
jgi:hypothetical protein